MNTPKLTIEYISERLDFMRSNPTEWENLTIENKLYGEILTAIANGTCEKPREAARLAIKTLELPFPRYIS